MAKVTITEVIVKSREEHNIDFQYTIIELPVNGGLVKAKNLAGKIAGGFSGAVNIGPYWEIPDPDNDDRWFKVEAFIN